MKPQEEWVDGSWTVDCVCGVNFDDGKEMVNCDECGVWVHTWCSCYVKGDDLFACHKCKIKKNETEVSAAATASAKLLVTETLRMESLSAQGHTVSMNRGFRACTKIPIEERVHVQGVAGGDLALFEGFSSIFSRQLWKCTGYVPKRFRFQYREFPCWDDQKENVCEVEDHEDTCDGVLLSMSKENDIATLTGAAIGTNDEMLGVKDRRRSFGSRETEVRCSQNDEINKGKSLLCPLSTVKRRREDSEDRVKRKVKVADKEDEDDKNDLVGKTLRML